jgi:FKBP-type peptidyl-prolyl cis-trans isomerase
VDYDGYFTTGALLDTSRERGPFTFELGARRVNKLWDRGLVGMRVGGKRRPRAPGLPQQAGGRCTAPLAAHLRD